jgi:hypothetical protein
MHPKITSRVLLAFALAVGLSFTPLAEAQAQHSGHHGHEGHGAKKPAKKAPAKKRSQHGGHGAAASGAVGEYQVAHHKRCATWPCRIRAIRTSISASR